MAIKRKYNQISKKQSLSSSEKLSEKEEIKHQNKRMKLDNTPDDNKVMFESRRKRKISQSKLNKKNLEMLLFLVKDQALQINLLRIQLLITQSSLWGIKIKWGDSWTYWNRWGLHWIKLIWDWRYSKWNYRCSKW